MSENPDGTLKGLPNVKDVETDHAIQQIAERGQSKNFKIMDALPVAADGAIGNIVLAKDGGAWYICGKTSDGWKKAIIT